jgi:protein-disulfide isomerase
MIACYNSHIQASSIPMNHHSSPKFNKELWLTPISILVGSLIIACSISLNEAPTAKTITATSPAANAVSVSLKDIRPLSSTDHVLGNRSAKVVLVEYSDTECPYCKSYHQTLHQIIDKYGKDIAWVYRHNPLPIHPKAQKEAEATECAAELGGNEKFWAYLDQIFKITPSNNKLDPAELPKIAVSIGLNEKAFTDCLNSGKHAARIEIDRAEIVKAGQTGTPSAVFITKNGNIGLRGAVSYERLEAAVKEALAK